MDMLKLCISVGAVWGCDHPELMVWGRFKHKNGLVKKNDHVLAYLVLSPHTWLEIVLTSHQKYPVLLPLPQLQIVWISCQKYLFLLPLTQLYIVWTSRQEYSILLTLDTAGNCQNFLSNRSDFVGCRQPTYATRSKQFHVFWLWFALLVLHLPRSSLWAAHLKIPSPKTLAKHNPEPTLMIGTPNMAQYTPPVFLPLNQRSASALCLLLDLISRLWPGLEVQRGAGWAFLSWQYLTNWMNSLCVSVSRGKRMSSPPPRTSHHGEPLPSALPLPSDTCSLSILQRQVHIVTFANKDVVESRAQSRVVGFFYFLFKTFILLHPVVQDEDWARERRSYLSSAQSPHKVVVNVGHSTPL